MRAADRERLLTIFHISGGNCLTATLIHISHRHRIFAKNRFNQFFSVFFFHCFRAQKHGRVKYGIS